MFKIRRRFKKSYLSGNNIEIEKCWYICLKVRKCYVEKVDIVCIIVAKLGKRGIGEYAS